MRATVPPGPRATCGISGTALHRRSRKASQTASQARWLSKPQSRNYFRGAEKDYNFKPVVLMQFHAVGSNPCRVLESRFCKKGTRG